MSSTPHPSNEASRLQALASSGALTLAAKPVFDRIAKAAAKAAGAPVGLVSFISADRQWVKASVGLDVTDVDRDSAFCAWTVYNAELMWVEDTFNDARFADHPMVLGEPNIRSYVGAPVVSPAGYSLGTVCAIDMAPRAYDPRIASRFLGLAARTAAVLRSAKVAMKVTA